MTFLLNALIVVAIVTEQTIGGTHPEKYAFVLNDTTDLV
jgi:hypothetical protein